MHRIKRQEHRTNKTCKGRQVCFQITRPGIHNWEVYQPVSMDTVLLSFSENLKSLLSKYPKGNAMACSKKVGSNSFNPFTLKTAADWPTGLAVRMVVNRTPASGRIGVIFWTVLCASSLSMTPKMVGSNTTWRVDIARPYTRNNIQC